MIIFTVFFTPRITHRGVRAENAIKPILQQCNMLMILLKPLGQIDSLELKG